MSGLNLQRIVKIILANTYIVVDKRSTDGSDQQDSNIRDKIKAIGDQRNWASDRLR